MVRFCWLCRWWGWQWHYSWGHLVVPYTEELISRPFLDENSIRQLFWDHLNPWPATGGFFPRPLSLLFCLSEVCCAHRSFSRGFLQKRPKWISHQCNFAFLLCQPLAATVHWGVQYLYVMGHPYPSGRFWWQSFLGQRPSLFSPLPDPGCRPSCPEASFLCSDHS